MRVLVTGGAGFIGSHLADAFLGRGDEVDVLDDLSHGRPGRLAPEAALHRASVTDATALAEIVEKVRPELVCHLAAQIDVRQSVADPAADAQANIVGTINVLEAARAAGARVLFASTGGAIYGRDAVIPSDEEQRPEPEAPYGTAKFCAEQYIGLFNRLYGTRHAVLRLANVYGPRQDPAGEAGVIAIFCGAVLRGERPTVFGDGRQTRDYVHVADVAAAFVAAAGSPRAGVWNVGTGVETDLLTLTGLIGRAAGTVADPVFAPARPGELVRSALDASRAARELGWRPSVPLAEGVKSVYEWARAGSPDRTA
ncbi:NAD-dependent epimerase/dehydratase family protein [Microbispora sp. RL4-1S]|uniref:NAD-dependent epimerase/dehydratase family protein n=1 Tax=Microbispora oryzae TaxID=2806554 RepID=A0A940WL19_9ACTN|nr:NAD-dependent epimerase/dehydratase family protein [Microbispora oryzae]MBP2703071.1 NAD-dependent epimerase/dehydratase family protein [Microbispora oryzae]